MNQEAIKRRMTMLLAVWILKTIMAAGALAWGLWFFFDLSWIIAISAGVAVAFGIMYYHA